MFPTTAPAHDPTVVTSPKRQVTAHTWSNERQGDKGHPPEAKHFITGVTRARIRVVSFWVGHTVIEHSVRTPHTAHSMDASLDAVRSILALTPLVLLVVEHVPAVHAPRPLTVFLPPGLEFDRLSLYHSTLGVFTQVEVRVVYVRVSVFVFGGLAFGKTYVGVHVVGIKVLSSRWGMAIILVSSHPDLFPRIDAHYLLVIVWEVDVPVGSWSY